MKIEINIETIKDITINVEITEQVEFDGSIHLEFKNQKKSYYKVNREMTVRDFKEFILKEFYSQAKSTKTLSSRQTNGSSRKRKLNWRDFGRTEGNASSKMCPVM